MLKAAPPGPSSGAIGHRASRSDSENVRRGPKRTSPWQTPQTQCRGSNSRKMPKKGVFEQPKATLSPCPSDRRSSAACRWVVWWLWLPYGPAEVYAAGVRCGHCTHGWGGSLGIRHRGPKKIKELRAVICPAISRVYRPLSQKATDTPRTCPELHSRGRSVFSVSSYSGQPGCAL